MIFRTLCHSRQTFWIHVAKLTRKCHCKVPIAIDRFWKWTDLLFWLCVTILLFGRNSSATLLKSSTYLWNGYWGKIHQIFVATERHPFLFLFLYFLTFPFFSAPKSEFERPYTNYWRRATAQGLFYCWIRLSKVDVMACLIRTLWCVCALTFV